MYQSLYLNRNLQSSRNTLKAIALCNTMSTWAHIFIIVILTSTTIVSLVEANICSTEQPIDNGDFKILCTKSRLFQVTITCRTTEGWSNFPLQRLNLTHGVKTVIFKNCSFPQDLSLVDITRSLGLVNLDTLKFESSQSALGRNHLKGFAITTLQFTKNSFNGMPNDLLYDISIEDLFIENGDMASIPKDFFKNSSNLKNLEIVYNKLNKIRRDDFATLANLRNLSLFGNEIDETELGTFDNLTNLRVLDLSKNKLKTFHPDTFKSLVKLETINMGENDIDELPSDLLRIENSRLQRVRLNYNRGELASLPDKFLSNLSSLHYAELTSNNFVSIPADLFLGTYSLTSLNISNNSLVDLPPKIFDSTNSLTELWIAENNLESLPEEIFAEVNLERLYLDYNRLTNLSSGVLKGLANLKVFQVSYNNLKHIDHKFCEYLKKIEYVDLSHNELTLENPNTEHFSVFVSCLHIIDIDLSYNNISEIFNDWDFTTNLKRLNLENNTITSLTVRDIQIFHTNVKVNLGNNKISTIDLVDLEKLVEGYRNLNPDAPHKNIFVYLEGNPLNCDCNLLHFLHYLEGNLSQDVYNYIKFSAKNLSCASPLQLESINISKIRSEQLRCLIKSNITTDACSNACTCWGYPGKEVLLADCSYQNLISVPANIENNRNWSIELNLSGNKFQRTPSMNHSYLLNVTALDLSSNNISVVSLDVFSHSLRDLKLHNNSISRLDSKVVDYLSEETLLRNLTLHKNKWICDCGTRNFLSIVRKYTIHNLNEVRCYGTNRPLSKMTSEELCEDAIAIIVGASLLVAVFGVILGSLAALYYRYQKEIKVWLYSKQWCLWFVTEDELDKGKQYDAFISYSHKDEDFVENEIVAKLEEGPKPYKLCLHYRDWLAGEWISAQIARSVEESRRTIVVLSPNFIESVWGRMEFQTAHRQALSEGRARVIIILYGDIGNIEALDPELKAYLTLNTYLKWGDPWFWDKLKYALPHRNESSRRKTRNARIIENHLAQLPVNNHDNNGKAEIIPMPKITASTNDSVKLLHSNADDERITITC